MLWLVFLVCAWLLVEYPWGFARGRAGDQQYRANLSPTLEHGSSLFKVSVGQRARCP
jgi:hypothetical protein